MLLKEGMPAYKGWNMFWCGVISGVLMEYFGMTLCQHGNRLNVGEITITFNSLFSLLIIHAFCSLLTFCYWLPALHGGSCCLPRLAHVSVPSIPPFGHSFLYLFVCLVVCTSIHSIIPPSIHLPSSSDRWRNKVGVPRTHPRQTLICPDHEELYARYD